MRIRSSRLQRVAAATLSLAAVFGIACWLPARGFGQDVDKSDKPDKSKPAGSPESSTHPEASVEKKRAPVGGNPLLIRPDGLDTDSAAQSPLSHDFNDYRHLDTSPQKSTGRTLPLFGYDIFGFARDMQDAQRTFLRRQSLTEFNGQGTSRTNRSTDTTTGDVPETTNGTRAPRRPAGKPASDDGSVDTSGRRAVDTNSDTNNGDEADTDTTSPTARRRTTRRKTQSGDNSQDAYQDNSLDNSAGRNRDSSDTEVQNAYTTPAGPISLLYRGIPTSMPDNYTIASGDVLRIRLESPTMDPAVFKRTVDPRGQIQLDNIGSVVIRGHTIDSAEKALETRLRPYFKNVRVSIEGSLLRMMPILVTGAAYVPGTYSVPATATAFNLLNIAGGPSDDGSLRGVEVRRQGKKIATLDIYKMITGDAQWKDMQLESGDVIIVPPRKSRVTVSGEVLHPAVFELLPTETLRDALAYAGGIKATGLNQSVRVNTVVPGAERIIKDLNLTDTLIEKQNLFDGDQVEVFSVRNRLNNRVTIEGAVDQPNDYALQPGMRVADLVERARGPLTEAYLPKAELHRWQPDNTDLLVVIDLEKALARDPKANLDLQKWDRLKVYTRDEVAWTGRRKVTVDGAVKKPGVYDVSKNMKVSDLLRMAGGPTPDAELEKAHLFHQHDDGPPTHEYVNVAAAVKGDLNRDPEVMDSDRLILFTVEQASFTPDHRVDVKGEVVNPGRYPRWEGMKVSELIALAGGFKPSAGDQVQLAHARRVADAPNTKVVSINFDKAGRCAAAADVSLDDGDVVSVKAVGGYSPEVQSFTVTGAVKNPGVIFLKSKDMRLSDAIREAGGLRPEAFPDGAEFYRNPQMLATTGQRSLVQSLSGLNDLLNDSETKRELAKAQIELIKATGNAISDSAGLGALTGGAGAVAVNPAASAVAGNINGQQLVSPARKLGATQLDPNGFVAVDLKNALAHPKAPDDIILVDGDVISVPETPTTVSVIGGVNSPRGILFEPGKRIDYYLDLAGGLSPDAAKDRIVIFHQGGGVIPGKRAHELKQGDIVFVPTKVLAAKIAGKSNGFDSFFKSITSTALLFRLFGL